jgi:predicted PurR-regulated permease PerM
MSDLDPIQSVLKPLGGNELRVGFHLSCGAWIGGVGLIMAKGLEHQELTVTWRTLLKIAAACLLGYTVWRLTRFVELFLLALLIAIAFRPLLRWTTRRGWYKWAGIVICGLILFGFTGLLFGVLVPTIGNQGMEFVKKLPSFRENLLERLPVSGEVRNLAERAMSGSPFSDPGPLLKQVVAWGGAGLERVIEFFLVLVVALYLLAEGGGMYRWLAAFLPEAHRRKVAGAAEEITDVVGHYVAGNIFTSVLCAIFVFIVLKVLQVPNAVLLAVLAGVFDLLPIIGFFMFTIPATLVALTVSPRTAVLVAVCYAAYHLLENYFIVPKVYGNRLRLSELTVLLSCLAAGWVTGVVGVILVLPIVACYPIVERIWLRPYLERDTVKQHEELDAGSGKG